ncbi:hypothetical protein FA15DRAFT_654865 [Coprinopsis marcescibilis]|uniref:Apple domain-containing protein n=1 Tax=Coprinopsis marcescibilis TaxID=230819 RepID=A0A5C3LBU1_COPMA|nr:hypothetical protein FA15DRAFT_654865 [Coprinopsis marcescibilis]
MKLSKVLAIALAVGSAGAQSASVTVQADPSALFGGVDMSAENFYGAGPIKPWEPNARPGWYYGQFPWLWPWLPWLHGPICGVLPWFPWLIQCPKPWVPPKPPQWPWIPHPPGPWWPWPGHPTPKPPTPPSDGYYQTFKNFTGATQAGDYLTFGLVDTIADCKSMCNTVKECNFANSYNDVNGKDGSKKLTCSLYSKCHSSKDATNTGGQTQPDGSINYIRNSDGWCKNGQKPINP